MSRRRRNSRRRNNTTQIAASCVESLENRALLAAAFAEFVDPNPSFANRFGEAVVPLSNGNVVVTSPYDNAGGVNAGAVYLFNGATGELISTLTGSQDDDNVGSNFRGGGITTLTNGNFLITSSQWSNGSIASAGAVTFASGVTGATGVVSSENSLVGSLENQQLGKDIFAAIRLSYPSVVALPNGNYVVTNEDTPNGSATDVGSVTHGNGSTGTTGVISTANSLLGSRSHEEIGNGGITILANGNYVISSPTWDNEEIFNAGAITFVNGETGLTGVVDETNSLVGGHRHAGLSSVTALSNGNFVVRQPEWRNSAGDTVGAVTLVDGTTGATGLIDPSDSLTGSTDNDEVGTSVTPLSNGNYIVVSPRWNNGAVGRAGAATWQSGTEAIGAVVSEANSLVGSATRASIGSGGVAALSNGNAVVSSGVATTFIDGTTGRSGVVSAENSLFFNQGTISRTSEVTALPNGNYVVASYGENAAGTKFGALTLVNGETGISGGIFSGNSLVDVFPETNDPPLILTNSNYVQTLEDGSLYFGSGTVPPTGQFSSDDDINLPEFNPLPYPLTNGNFVFEVRDPETDEWTSLLVDGSVGLAGEIPNAGRLNGGPGGVALGNGNYAFRNRLDLVVGDGENPGVGVATTFEVAAGTFTNSPTPISDNGSFVYLNPAYDLGDLQDVGAIAFVSGSPDFTAGTVTSNFLVGTVSRGYFGDPITDVVNGHFYVRYVGDGVARIHAGSTIDGFDTDQSGPEVNLSVSTNAATEADMTQITVTATAAAAVSGDQTVIVLAGGTASSATFDADFTSSRRTITIRDGQTSGGVTLTIEPDYLREGTESIILSLANPSAGIQLGTAPPQSITIEDDTATHLSLDAVPRFPTDTTPTFTWNDVGADRYEVWLEQTSPNRARLQVESKFVTGTSYTSTEELMTGTYRMWVRVFENYQESSPWAPRGRFEYRPQLLAPLSAVSTLRPTFSWEAIPDAQAYQIYVGTSSGRIIEGDIVGTSWTPSEDLAAGNIRWWIRDMASTSGGWSGVGNASVGGSATPGPTTVLTPTGSTTDTTPTFSWEAIADSSRYILHVQNLTTGNVVIRENNLTSTSFSPATALPSGDFRVWVKAIGGSGGFADGTWSDSIDFTIAAVSSEPADALTPLLTSLPAVLEMEDSTQMVGIVAAETPSSGDEFIVAQARLPNDKQHANVDNMRLQPVATADASDSLLSLLWEQPQLPELLLEVGD